MRVFIADDSPAVRHRLVSMVSGFKNVDVVGQSDNVMDAKEAIRLSNPQVVILDISMPGGSGIDVLKDIKHDQPTRIVIVLTNYPFPQYRKECMDSGADFFFDKSLEFHLVETAISELNKISESLA